jgi:hypothetical protein
MNRQDARHDTSALDDRIEDARPGTGHQDASRGRGTIHRAASRDLLAAPGHALHGLVPLAVVPLLFAVNALANHVMPIPGGRIGYSLVVIFGAGTVLPALALAWLVSMITIIEGAVVTHFDGLGGERSRSSGPDDAGSEDTRSPGGSGGGDTCQGVADPRLR